MRQVPGARRLAAARRVAVLRGGGLGDLVVAEPALAALRAAAPAAEVVLLADEHHRRLLDGRPGPVDRVVVLPRAPGLHAAGTHAGPPDDDASVERWCAQRRAEDYDLAVQLHGGGRHSNPLLLRTGARTTVGAATPDAARLDRTLSYPARQHELLRCLEVVAAAGAPAVRLEPQLVVTPVDRAASARAVPDDGRPLVVVHPGATDPRRRYPEDRLGAAVAPLAAQGARVLVVGGPGEQGLVRTVAAAAGPGAEVAPPLGLPALLGTLERARLLVGNDSGPRHLAQAVGTATAAVFSVPSVLDVGPLQRERHRVVLDPCSACARCGAPLLGPACGHGVTALGGVAVEELAEQVLSLWQQEADHEVARAQAG